VVHADTGGLSRLTASSSSVAATVAPSVRIVPATGRTQATRHQRIASLGGRGELVELRGDQLGRAPSSRNRTASSTSGSTPPRESYVDKTTRISRLPFPQVLASADDSAAPPGSCRKPPGGL